MTQLLTPDEVWRRVALSRLVRVGPADAQRIVPQQQLLDQVALQAPEPKLGDCFAPFNQESSEAGDFFVNPSSFLASDDKSGTSPITPWKTLAKVRAKLGVAAYRGGVRIWIHTDARLSLTSEEMDPAANTPMLEILSWGTALHPIVIGSYDLGAFPWTIIDDATKGQGATFDGEDPFFEQKAGSENLPGIQLIGACHVILQGLNVRSFDEGILMRACREILISGCKVHDNFDRGIAILQDADDDELTSRNVTVSASHVHDNGWNTGGSNIAFGTNVADCVVHDCEIFGSTAVRGIDGLVFDGSSSGHIIERNKIYGHVSTRDPDAGTDDGDGIDLKGVRQRSAQDGAVTVIRDNEIVDNQNDGIVIHQGVVGVHIFRNRIWRNKTGVNIMPGNVKSQDCEDLDALRNPFDATDTAVYPGLEQAEIYLYRNIIGRNLTSGVVIELGNAGFGGLDACLTSAGDPGRFSLYREILVVNNTIDYNGDYGIQVTLAFTNEETAAMDASWQLTDMTRWFQDIGIYNNILSRNGVRLARKSTTAAAESTPKDYSQLYLGDLIASTSTGESDLNQFYVDHNLYEMPRQALALTPAMESPVHFRFFTWDGDEGKLTVNKQTKRQRTLMEFNSDSATLGAESWSAASGPTSAGFVDELPRDPDHHLDGTSRAVSNAVWFAPAGFRVTHHETGAQVPLSGDYDGVFGGLPDIGAFNV